jgi:hypothetical protein
MAKLKALPWIIQYCTSHGLGVGAVDEMVFHPEFEVISAIWRGKWDYRSEYYIFEYCTFCLFVNISEKVLKRGIEPRTKVSVPSLNAILTLENKDLLDNFMGILFAG